jgi:hypothetical protein
MVFMMIYYDYMSISDHYRARYCHVEICMIDYDLSNTAVTVNILRPQGTLSY